MVLFGLQPGLQVAPRRVTERSIARMRRIHLAVLAALVMLPASAASASPVLVYDGDRAVRENDPFVPADMLPAPPGPAVNAAPVARASAATVRGTLASFLSSGQLSQGTHDALVRTYDEALAVRNRMAPGLRHYELSNAINVLHGLAARGQLTISRLQVLFLQLRRNTEVWGSYATLPTPGARVRFGASRLLFQYYRGQGLQFHPLANWGRASALLNSGYEPNGLSMIYELLPLASYRGTALTWEYFFYFGGGAPPWTSGLSQGTALVALSAAARLRPANPRYASTGLLALRLFELPAPLGVRVRSRWGAHYAEYSYAPRLRIINGFIQALNGLHDLARVTGDPRAQAAFRLGEVDARRSMPYFDTGRWSRYSNTGVLSSVGYHVLLRDFLSGLCSRIRYYAYCSKAARFSYYLRLGYPTRR